MWGGSSVHHTHHHHHHHHHHNHHHHHRHHHHHHRHHHYPHIMMMFTCEGGVCAESDFDIGRSPVDYWLLLLIIDYCGLLITSDMQITWSWRKFKSKEKLTICVRLHNLKASKGKWRPPGCKGLASCTSWWTRGRRKPRCRSGPA